MTRTTAAYRAPSKVSPTGITLTDAAESYLRSCRARGLSDETLAIYRVELEKLDEYLSDHGMPRVITAIKREHIESHLSDLQERG